MTKPDRPDNNNAPVDEPKAPDATDVFWALAGLCYGLYRILGAIGQFMNDRLQKISDDMAARSKALELAQGCTPSGTDKMDLGGTGDEAAALKKANDFIDALHSCNVAMDFPPGYDKDPSVKVTASTRLVPLTQFNSWSSQLNIQLEQLRNNGGVETTKADGIMKSSSATIELATTTVSNITKSCTTVASAIKM